MTKNCENFDVAVEAAEASMKNLIDKEYTFQVSFEKTAYRVIESIVALHRAGEQDPARYAAFLKERGVRITKRTINPFHATTAALVQESVRRDYRQRVTLYAQVARAFSLQTVCTLSEWLDKAEDVNGQVLTGLAKGTAVYHTLPEVAEYDEERRSRRQAKRAAASETTVHTVTNGDEGPVLISSANLQTNAISAVALGYLDTDGNFVVTRTITTVEIVASVEQLTTAISNTADNENNEVDEVA